MKYKMQAHETIANDRGPIADQFDRIVGQAVLSGTLNIENLLFLLRGHIVAGEPVTLDAFAHIVLEL